MQRYLSYTHRNGVWFKRALDSGELSINPPFQRNPVWSDKQKSSLIVTMLLEYPIPELYMQELTESSGAQKHIVVDGQQRVRAVLSFIAGEFELDDDSGRWAGAKFDDLAAEDRKKLFEYNFVVRQLPEMPDDELRAIFQRINRNTVTLNPQELRRATYWGEFITLMETLADLDFWTFASIFSANDRRRMLDVEFVSELTVAMLNGLQNKKKNLEQFYQQYETSFDDAGTVRGAFGRVLGELEQLLPDLPKTRWRKKSDFYSLFLKFARHQQLLPLSSDSRDLAKRILMGFAADVDSVIAQDIIPATTPPAVLDYVRNVERAATDLGARKAREVAIDTVLAPVFPIAALETQIGP